MSGNEKSSNLNYDDYCIAIGTQKGGVNIGKNVINKLCISKELNNLLINNECVAFIIGTEIHISTQNKKLKSQFLNYPNYFPNTKYIFTENFVKYIVEIDDKGRRKSLFAETENVDCLKHIKRSNRNQPRALIFYDGHVPYPSKNKANHIYNDQGGHIFPKQCGGSDYLINIFPQAHFCNNSKSWKSHEKKTKDLIQNCKKVKLFVEFEYENNGKRPIKIIKTYIEPCCMITIDDINKVFLNTNKVF